MLASLRIKISFPASPDNSNSVKVLVSSHCGGKMGSPKLDLNKWYEGLKDQALSRNDKSVAIWAKYKNDLEVTKSLLSSLPQKLSHKVMVPLGPKALVPGRIVHTNEFLVNLGETWFVKRSALQATEICNRKVKSCEEMLKKLEKERELIINRSKLPAEKEAFGNEERPEIVEYVTEEENEVWRKQHRLNEKKYRQELAALKNKEKKPIETEEDLWKRLDELELQEELEDELNRLNELDSSQDESENEPEIPQKNEDSTTTDEIKKSNAHKPSRKVSFACDFDSSDDEPLRLEIKHNDWEPELSVVNDKTINSPGDIYMHYLKTVSRTPISVLKNDINPNKEAELEKIKNNKSYSDDGNINESEISDDQLILFENSPVNVINDVVERNSVCVEKEKVVEKGKRVSKFKASRKKNC